MDDEKKFRYFLTLQPPTAATVDKFVKNLQQRHKETRRKIIDDDGEIDDDRVGKIGFDGVLHSGQSTTDAINENFNSTGTPANVPISGESKSTTEELKTELDCSFHKNTSAITMNDERPPRSNRKRTKKRLSIAFKRAMLLQTQLSVPIGERSLLNKSGIEGPTILNDGYKVSSQILTDALSEHEHQHLTIVSLEVHAATSADLRPDPAFHPIQALFYSIYHDTPNETNVVQQRVGIVVVDPFRDKLHGLLTEKGYQLQHGDFSHVQVTYAQNEKDLFQNFIDIFHSCDPDILVGYEIQMLSWGLLVDRAAYLGLDLKNRLSRLDAEKGRRKDSPLKRNSNSTALTISGRLLLNLWTILREELTLNHYSFENVVFHVLHRRTPKYTYKQLTSWWSHASNKFRYRVINYYLVRCNANIELLNKLDLVSQTSEFARVFGIEFKNVLSRGSQYRVESMMLRIAKPLNYLAVSPSVQQRAHMRAPECIPLTMEPESKLYTDPVVVLDFQSLYPSIMIAYNICFSTCLGRLKSLEETKDGCVEFGCTSLHVPPEVLAELEDDVNITPNGMVFVKPYIRKGILPRMVDDILNTRLMVKDTMKMNLKSKVGDAILRKARETLERAIKMVETHPRWNCHVVYGDTDSLFIEMKGRTKDEAFDLGYEIVRAITQDNPKPVKLKFEKVYQPCVLLTKKRYVGFMYETKDQAEPKFDAKGIETVRRDTCSAVSKVLERSIKILFQTNRIPPVQRYVTQQCTKILQDRYNMIDCIFAKEYRGYASYKPGACVPALEITRRRLRDDPRGEPRTGERVPYVIVHGTPGQTLIQLVREPQELLDDPNLRINTHYYISRQILPPLDRILSLVGADVRAWYEELPKHMKLPPQLKIVENKGNIVQFFPTAGCACCGAATRELICENCSCEPQTASLVLQRRVSVMQRSLHRATRVCALCMDASDHRMPCIAVDCQHLFRYMGASRKVALTDKIMDNMEVCFPTQSCDMHVDM